MNLRLNVYTDESLTEIRRVCEADKLKIPYRVAMYLVQSLDSLSLNNEDDILKFVTGNVDKMDKIVKATFGVSDTELEYVDGGELIGVLKELYEWGIEKVKTLKSEGDRKNVPGPAKF